MRCPSSARIAAAASGEDPAAAAHAAGCATCAALLTRDRATRAVLAAAPEVRLGAGDRAAQRAELLAASDAMPIRRRRGYRVVVAGLAVAAAAAVAFVIVRTSQRPAPPDGAMAQGAGSQLAAGTAAPVAARKPGPTAADAAAAVAPLVDGGSASGPAPPTPVAEVVSRGARFERTGDLVKVADGAVTLDARGRRAAQVAAQGARVRIDDAKVRVTVRAGRLIQVQVFAGSAEVEVAGRTQVIEVGDSWQAPAPARPPRPASAVPSPTRAPARPSLAVPPPTPAPARPSPALAAFRVGWDALRAGRNADAIAAFDRATDPAVAEDASYWAAIAAERSGDHEAAQRRLRAFLNAFPASPHADEARAALQR